MADLRTRYLGLELAHPVVASASPISKSLDGIRRLEDGGVSAIVMFSLFEEQIRADTAAIERLAAVGAESVGEAAGYFPPMDGLRVGPDNYLELIRRAKAAVDVPVIASLNGVTPEGWADYAADMAAAGADAIELNVYYIPSAESASAREVEDRYVSITRRVVGAVSVPVAVKLSPYFSAPGEMAARLVDAGASGLVLFNRFYQPDFDLEQLEVTPSLELSTPAEQRLPLLWIAVLHGRLRASLAATTGVETAEQVVKYVLAGADAVMTTSALLRHGPGHARQLVEGLNDWIDRRGAHALAVVRGSMSQRRVADPAAFERANYIRVLESWTDADEA
ncbi:MAG: dihydroorotate dehydrogenase-like protein [Vicinamibacterales bacterium]